MENMDSMEADAAAKDMMEELNELGLSVEVVEGDEDGDMDVDASGVSFENHSDAVFCVAYHPLDDSIAVSGGADDKAFIWNTQDGSLIHCLEGHSDSIVDVQFNFDGSLVGTAGMDGFIRIWDCETGNLKIVLEGPSEEIEWMSFHPRGNVVCAGSTDSTVWLWNADNGKVMHVLAAHAGSTTAGGFDPSGKRIISAGEDGAIYIWNPKTEEKIGGVVHESPISALSLTESLIAVGSVLGVVKIISIKNGQEIGEIFQDCDLKDVSIESLEFSPSGQQLTIGAVSGMSALADISHHMKTRARFPHALECPFHSVKQSPDLASQALQDPSRDAV